MFESFTRSIGIVKKSFGVLMEEKRLMLFPLLSTIAMIAVLASFLLPAIFIQNQALLVILLALFYFVSYFVVIFFNSALIHAANEKLEGRAVSLGASVSFALSRILNIALWAGISATVGLILNMINSMASRQKGIGALIARLVVSVVGMAWTFATFFVVPVMVFENVSPIEAIKRSIDLVKKTWSEQMLGGFALGGVFFLIYLGCIALIVGGFVFPLLMLLLLPLGLMMLFLTFIMQGAIEGIFIAELYRYSMKGEAVVFNDEIETARAGMLKSPGPQ